MERAGAGAEQRLNPEPSTDASAFDAARAAESGVRRLRERHETALLSRPDAANRALATGNLRLASASLLIFLFGWLASEVRAAVWQPVVWALYLAAIASCATFQLLIGRAVFVRRWRALTLMLAALLFASSAAICAITAQSEPVFILVMLVIMGCAAFMPWGVRWQGALGLMGIAVLAAGWYLHPTPDGAVYRWAGIAAIAVLAHFATLIRARDRSEASQRMRALRESRDQLLAEIERRRELDAARARAQRQLAQSEAKFRAIFDASLDAIAITRLDDGRYVDVNRAFTIDAGYSREEALNASVTALNVWPSRAERSEFTRRLRANRGVLRNYVAELRDKNGSLRPYLISTNLIEVDGCPCVVSFSRDITEMKRAQSELLAAREELNCRIAALHESQRQLRAEIAERELAQKKVQESEATLRKIFDTTLVAIAIVRKADGRFIGANREFLRIFGYAWEEIHERPFQQVTPWVDHEQLRSFSRALARAGAVAETEADVRANGGRIIPLQISAATVELNGEPCIITMSRDITRRRLAERDMIYARESALAASQAKSDFLSSMSHEIRTPMNAILGMADLLSETPLTAEQRRYLDTMRANGASLLDLINRVLDLARIESGQLSLEHTAFRLDELINEVLETLGPRARQKRLTLVRDVMDGVPVELLGDPLRLRQILMNLLGNAINFTDRGGITLTVCRAASVSARFPVASSRTQPAQVRLRFVVSDTGIGIAREKLATIFSSFAQADSSVARTRGGSGLGLAIVKRLVELMDGEITVRSSPGLGSSFSFTVALAAGSDASPQPVENEPEIAGTILNEPVRILLAEDSSDNRLLIQAYLKNTPYQLDFAEDGGAAIELFKSNRYDLVLMDIQMPIVDGLTAVRAMRTWEGANRYAPIPIIALTASALDESVRRCMNAGCTAHIAKPVRKATLLAAIANTLRREHHATA